MEVFPSCGDCQSFGDVMNVIISFRRARTAGLGFSHLRTSCWKMVVLSKLVCQGYSKTIMKDYLIKKVNLEAFVGMIKGSQLQEH